MTAVAENADFVVGAAAASAFLASAGRGSAFKSLVKAAVDILAGSPVRNLRVGRAALDVHHHLASARGCVDPSLCKYEVPQIGCNGLKWIEMD